MSQLSDMEQLRQRQERLDADIQTIAKLSVKVGKAKQVKEFHPIRRDRALALAMTPFLQAGDSAAAAEAKARASYNYGETMKELARDLEDAETVLAEWEAAKIISDSDRTQVSLEKELVRL